MAVEVRSSTRRLRSQDGDGEVKKGNGAKAEGMMRKLTKGGGEGGGGVGGGGFRMEGVLYIGHVPHGFYEDEMASFFSQFGTVVGVKVSRSKKTGNSKGYGFVHFKSHSVAQIAVKALDGYILSGQVLQCRLVEPEAVHPETFKGCEKKFRKVPWQKIAAEVHNKVLAPADEEKRLKKLIAADNKRRRKIKAAGIDYDFEGYGGEEPKEEQEQEQEQEPAPKKRKIKTKSGAGEVGAKKKGKGKEKALSSPEAATPLKPEKTPRTTRKKAEKIKKSAYLEAMASSTPKRSTPVKEKGSTKKKAKR